jgi:hypothetical protein
MNAWFLVGTIRVGGTMMLKLKIFQFTSQISGQKYRRNVSKRSLWTLAFDDAPCDSAHSLEEIAV